jgi:OmpA-OmpF porin, OOP family
VSSQAGRTPGVTLIRVDGRPTVACVLALDSSAGNKVARAADRDTFVAALRERMSQTHAQQPQTDYLRAAGLASASAGPGGLVVIDGSGLQTKPPLDFPQGRLLDGSITSTVETLARSGDLPDLRGRRVLLVGLGYTVAPQDDIGQNGQSHLIELWQRIAERAGATQVRVLDVPNTKPSVPGLPPVTRVPVPSRPAPRCNTESIFPDDGPVGFRPNGSEFTDPAGATKRLSDIGAWLVDHPRAHANVTGSVAHYGRNDPHGLSEGRAERVRDVLTGQGATDAQIASAGSGWGPFPDPNAAPDSRSDARNRRVTIELVC